jgi:hypothetical protein
VPLFQIESEKKGLLDGKIALSQLRFQGSGVQGRSSSTFLVRNATESKTVPLSAQPLAAVAGKRASHTKKHQNSKCAEQCQRHGRYSCHCLVDARAMPFDSGDKPFAYNLNRRTKADFLWPV